MSTFTVPYPPQANHMYTVARGRKIMSSEYREWKRLAAWNIKAQRPEPILGRYALDIVVPRPDRRGRDIDNLIKPISDAIMAAGIISDDKMAMSICIAWEGIEPSRGDVIVQLRSHLFAAVVEKE